MFSTRTNQDEPEFHSDAMERNALNLAVRFPFGNQPVAFIYHSSAMFYNHAILLKQAVSLPQQLLGSTERVVELGFEVFGLAVWPRHGAEFLNFVLSNLRYIPRGFALNND